MLISLAPSRFSLPVLRARHPMAANRAGRPLCHKERGARWNDGLYIFHEIGSISQKVPLVTTRALTANEAAAASRMPLKQVHRIVDAGLLGGAVETRRGTRLITGRGLLALKLAYVTADVLKPQARRRAVLRVLAEAGRAQIREQAVTVEVGGIEAELKEGLADLAAAKAMVAADPEIMGGTPCFAGTRIPVHDIADMMANGDTPAALREGVPDARRAADPPRTGLRHGLSAPRPAEADTGLAEIAAETVQETAP